jgi:Zn-dependent peptidase ImmA (M78 family)
VATDYASAVRAGTMAAARLHQRLSLRRELKEKGGSVDVFGAILGTDLPVLLRPLDGLLGVYLNQPYPGILVTTERRLSVQRFTAAHELGHYELKHQPSLDDDNILRRLVPPAPSATGFQEVEANAFAAEFLMPRWLISWHCNRHGWTERSFRRPDVMYQLSLRLGVSYEATCWTLARGNLITEELARELLQTRPREIKVALLRTYRPEDYRGDVWLLTTSDAGTQIDGSRNDVFVLRLEEHSGSGYVWNMDELNQSGFAVVRDERESLDSEGIGDPVLRRVTAVSPESHRGRISMHERRPWQPHLPLSTFTADFDLTGPEEEGLSRAERRSLLESEWP